MQALQLLFCLAQIPWIGGRHALRISSERGQPYINAKLFASDLVLNLPLRLHAKLDIVAINSPHYSHALNLLSGKVSMARVPTSRSRPMPCPSVKIMWRPSDSS